MLTKGKTSPQKTENLSAQTNKPYTGLTDKQKSDSGKVLLCQRDFPAVAMLFRRDVNH